MVGLKCLDRDGWPNRRSGGRDRAHNVLQRGLAVELRLARAEEIDVRAVEQQDLTRGLLTHLSEDLDVDVADRRAAVAQRRNVGADGVASLDVINPDRALEDVDRLKILTPTWMSRGRVGDTHGVEGRLPLDVRTRGNTCVLQFRFEICLTALDKLPCLSSRHQLVDIDAYDV